MTSKICVYEDCENEVDEDDYCNGCGYYICREHAINWDICGIHEPESHWCIECPELFEKINIKNFN